MTLKELRKRQAEAWAEFERASGDLARKFLAKFERLRQQEAEIRERAKREPRRVRR